MGEAKKRGTFEQRVESADARRIAREQAERERLNREHREHMEQQALIRKLEMEGATVIKIPATGHAVHAAVAHIERLFGSRR